jgi:hypothetical protein
MLVRAADGPFAPSRGPTEAGIVASGRRPRCRPLAVHMGNLDHPGRSALAVAGSHEPELAEDACCDGEG